MQRNNWKYLLTSILECGIFLANKTHTQATHIINIDKEKERAHHDKVRE